MKPFYKDIYVISDSADTLLQSVRDGAAIVQLRDKSADKSSIEGKARSIISFKQKRQFIFILNDDSALAVSVGADGVHIGQDMSTAEAKQIIGDKMILGKTTHNLEQARQAIKDGVAYISVGPVYATPTKPGRPAVGLEYVREASKHLAIPFVAIGGIDLGNIDEVLGAGAKTIGIVRAAKDVPAMLKKIRANAHMVNVIVNGKHRELPEGMSLQALCLSLNLNPARVIIERNEHVVARDQWSSVLLDENDRLELVSLVGGG